MKTFDVSFRVRPTENGSVYEGTITIKAANQQFSSLKPLILEHLNNTSCLDSGLHFDESCTCYISYVHEHRYVDMTPREQGRHVAENFGSIMENPHADAFNRPEADEWHHAFIERREELHKS